MKGRRFGISVSVAGCLMFDAYYKDGAQCFSRAGVYFIISMWQDETTNLKQPHMSRNEKRSVNRSLLRPPTMIVSDAPCDCLQS